MSPLLPSSAVAAGSSNSSSSSYTKMFEPITPFKMNSEIHNRSSSDETLTASEEVDDESNISKSRELMFDKLSNNNRKGNHNNNCHIE